ncbi:MAG TPA: hypothetical protein VMT89_00240, partial [Candidatus Acidoferrales bacterium]|nr:hypothetical protein [Candidatus Acidoferrales bacterium]
PRLLGFIPGLLCMTATLIGSRGEMLPLQWNAPDIHYAILWLFVLRAATVPAVLWALVLVVTILASIAGVLTRDGRRSLAQRGIWIVIALLLALAYLLAPPDVDDWSHLQERFVPLAALTVIGGATLPRLRALRIAVVATLVSATMLSLPITSTRYREGAAEIDAYLSRLGSLQPGAAVLPLYFGELTDAARPAQHAWAYHIIRDGGWTPYVQHAQQMRTARLLYPILYRTPPWAPSEANAELNSSLAQRAGDCYDYIVMLGAAAPSMEPIQQPFELVTAEGDLQIWRNRRGVRRATPADTAACRAD